MKKIIFILLVFALLAMPYSNVFGAQFNPNYIISDYELEDYNSLSEEAIQRFLESKGSFLAIFTEVVKGERKTASKIIFEEAQVYRINPKVILAMLQKEQSLITSSSPSQDQLDWATGFGMTDSSRKSDPRLAPLKGFYNQVTNFAEKVRVNYLRDLQSLGRTFTGWGPGITKTTLDGFQTTPANNATAVLYTYNPWRGGGRIGANYNFWRIWQRYFIRSYPDGTLLQETGEPGVWILQNGLRRPFATRAALLSRHNPDKIIQVTKNELEKYEIGAPIKFANYSLLRAPWGTVYLLVDDILRGISSQEVFRTIGFNPEEIINVSKEDIEAYTEGEKISISSAFPTGSLLQDNKTGGVFYVRDGKKQAIIDRSILEINFRNARPTSVHQEMLDKFEYSGRLKLEDGTIIKSFESPAVYIISEGLRMPIVSGEAFEKLGYRWKDIIEVPKKVVDIHEEGERLDILTINGDEEILGDNMEMDN